MHLVIEKVRVTSLLAKMKSAKMSVKQGFAGAVIFLLVISLSENACAQDTLSNSKKDHHRFWVSGGFGRAFSQVQPAGLPNITTQITDYSANKTAWYFGFMATAHFQPKNKRAVITSRYNINAELFHQHTPGIKASEVSVLYGIRTNNFIFSTGLSRLWGVDRGMFLHGPDPNGLFSGNYYEKRTYAQLGIPLEVRFILPLQWVSFGLTAFGNINDGHSYGGLNLSIVGGRFH